MTNYKSEQEREVADASKKAFKALAIWGSAAVGGFVAVYYLLRFFNVF